MIQTKKIKKSKSQFDRRGHVVTLRGMRVIQTSKCSSGQFNLTNYQFYNKINKLARRLVTATLHLICHNLTDSHMIGYADHSNCRSDFYSLLFVYNYKFYHEITNWLDIGLEH